MSLDISFGSYSGNITHNLAEMANAAGIYETLWRPHENGMLKAGDIIKNIEAGLSMLVLNKDEFIPYNDQNGWGTYDGFIVFLAEILAAAKREPEEILIVDK